MNISIEEVAFDRLCQSIWVELSNWIVIWCILLLNIKSNVSVIHILVSVPTHTKKLQKHRQMFKETYNALPSFLVELSTPMVQSVLL